MFRSSHRMRAARSTNRCVVYMQNRRLVPRWSSRGSRCEGEGVRIVEHLLELHEKHRAAGFEPETAAGHRRLRRARRQETPPDERRDGPSQRFAQEIPRQTPVVSSDPSMTSRRIRSNWPSRSPHVLWRLAKPDVHMGSCSNQCGRTGISAGCQPGGRAARSVAPFQIDEANAR